MEKLIMDIVLCFALAFLLVGGAIIIGSIFTVGGITVMRLRDRRTGKKRAYLLRVLK